MIIDDFAECHSFLLQTFFPFLKYKYDPDMMKDIQLFYTLGGSVKISNQQNMFTYKKVYTSLRKLTNMP